MVVKTKIHGVEKEFEVPDVSDAEAEALKQRMLCIVKNKSNDCGCKKSGVDIKDKERKNPKYDEVIPACPYRNECPISGIRKEYQFTEYMMCHEARLYSTLPDMTCRSIRDDVAVIVATEYLKPILMEELV